MFFAGHLELTILREKAEHLRDGILRSRGDALLPLSLATFIFEALVTASGTQQVRAPFYSTHRLPTDETLGFEAAVSALGLKAILPPTNNTQDGVIYLWFFKFY